MKTLSTLLWRFLADVRPAERGRFTFFVSLSGLMSVAQTLGLTGSEALFLARVGPEALPATFVLASVTTVLGSLVYAAVVGRSRNDALFVWILATGAVVLSAGTLGAWLRIPGTLVALFCFFFLAEAVYLSHYQTFAADYFDTLTSKRLIPLFTIGNSLGGFLGGMLAIGVIRVAPPETLIAAWAVLLFAAAVMLRVGRRRLRLWGPLELEEQDETSVEGIRAALRYIRHSRLARWLVVSSFGMVLALFVSVYIYSVVFAQQFPDAQQLAVFFAIYLAATNLVEVVVEVAILPRLIRRLGVPGANLTHPLITLSSFVGLAVHPGMATAIAARANRELLQGALAEPVRTLIYNAIPMRFRGRLRLFQEGIVIYSGMALAGLAILLLGDRVPVFWLCVLGGSFALVYLGANMMVRREYLLALVEQLRSSRLHLDELGDELGRFEVTRLADLWESLLAREWTYPSESELELASVLTRRGIVAPVIRAAQHRSPRVRRACVEALASSEEPGVEAVIQIALDDSDPSVRRGAVRAVGRRREVSPPLDAALLQRLEDSDLEVRAEACVALGPRGVPVLREMMNSDDSLEVKTALARLPRELLGDALDHIDASDPGTRAAAIESVSRIASPVPIETPALARELVHADPRVRMAAVRALATHSGAMSGELLATALADGNRDVRGLAAAALGKIGDEGVHLIEPALASGRLGTADAAMVALGAIRTPMSRGVLGRELRRRIHQGWEARFAVRAIPDDDDLACRFLRAAYLDAGRRAIKLAFRALELLEDARIIRTVDKVLRFSSPRSRADALEVLSNLGDREAARLLVLMLEDSSLEETLTEIDPTLSLPRTFDEVCVAARESEDRWVRLAGSGQERTREQEDLMERLLILRQISLFSRLSLDQLEMINRIMSEEQYLRGEVIMREGDLAKDLFVIVEGQVEFYSAYGEPSQTHLNTQRAGDELNYFGEMAILVDAPRSATAVAATDTTVLTLGGERLLELILEMPEISFEIFGVLTDRVRHADRRLQAALARDPEVDGAAEDS